MNQTNQITRDSDRTARVKMIPNRPRFVTTTITTHGVSKTLPSPPEPPRPRVIYLAGGLCINCHSPMSRSGFLGLFGKKYCLNDNCKNSKPKIPEPPYIPATPLEKRG